MRKHKHYYFKTDCELFFCSIIRPLLFNGAIHVVESCMYNVELFTFARVSCVFVETSSNTIHNITEDHKYTIDITSKNGG